MSAGLRRREQKNQPQRNGDEYAVQDGRSPRLDRIRTDAIRQKFSAATMADKMREAYPRWYGHALRGERPRGRPK